MMADKSADTMDYLSIFDELYNQVMIAQETFEQYLIKADNEKKEELRSFFQHMVSYSELIIKEIQKDTCRKEQVTQQMQITETSVNKPSEVKQQVKQQSKEFIIWFSKWVKPILLETNPCKGIYSGYGYDLNKVYIYPDADPLVVKNLYKAGLIYCIYTDSTLHNLKDLPKVRNAVYTFSKAIKHSNIYLACNQVIPEEGKQGLSMVEMRMGSKRFTPKFFQNMFLVEEDIISVTRAKQLAGLVSRTIEALSNNIWTYESEPNELILTVSKVPKAGAKKDIIQFLESILKWSAHKNAYAYFVTNLTGDLKEKLQMHGIKWETFQDQNMMVGPSSKKDKHEEKDTLGDNSGGDTAFLEE
jgi:hypothetical protein